jgi:hypothetical protein
MAIRYVIARVCLLGVLFFICGCCSGQTGLNQNQGQISVKTYLPATLESKQKLAEDLRSGSINRGASLDYLRSTYGDPDSMLVSGFGTRLVYYKAEKTDKIVLWFDDGTHLSAWSD